MKSRVERPVAFFDVDGMRVALDEETARLFERDWIEHLEFHRWVDWEGTVLSETSH